MSKIKIETNWSTTSALSKCIGVVNETDFKGINHDDVEAENCVECKQPEDTKDPLRLSLTLSDPNKVISRICVISQSKRIEIHEGDLENSGSYIMTVSGSLLGKKTSMPSAFQKRLYYTKFLDFFCLDDSDDDFLVYNIDETLNTISLFPRILLKFTNIVGDSCWILKFTIVQKIKDTSLNNFNRFNLHSLDSMLQKDNVKLSNNAQEFKQLFETFQKSGPPSTMLGLMQGGLPQNFESAAQSLIFAKSSGDTTEDTSIINSAIPSSRDKSKVLHDCDQCSFQMSEMEKRLKTKIEELERAQNEKLDKIISLLSSTKI